MRSGSDADERDRRSALGLCPACSRPAEDEIWFVKGYLYCGEACAKLAACRIS